MPSTVGLEFGGQIISAGLAVVNAANPSAFRSARIAALDDRFPSRPPAFSSPCVCVSAHTGVHARARVLRVLERSKNAGG